MAEIDRGWIRAQVARLLEYVVEPQVFDEGLHNLLGSLGTGGIMAPVMFYAPAAGKDAQLENTVELERTFP